MIFSARIFEKRWNSRGAGVGRWLLGFGCLMLGCLGLTAGGCGSSAVVTEDFTLAVAPANVALTAGGATQQITVTSTAVNGYSAQIAVTLSGLPSGVTANPASVMIAPGTTETITLTAAATAATSSGTVAITGTSGAHVHSGAVALSVTAVPPADFTISVNPTTVSVTAGGAGGSTAVSVSGVNGFTAGVGIAVSGLPAGVTVNPATPTVTPGTPQTLTVTAAASAVAGTSTVTVTGTSGALVHTATFTLKIAAAPADFTLAINPTSLTLTSGALGQGTAVTASAVNGFSGTVSVTVAGLPAGVTVAPTTLTLAPGTPQTLTFTAAANAAAGMSSVSITGVSGALTHTATLTLTVAAPVGVNVTTYHNDNSRDGLNASETILTPTNVSSATFGKLNMLGVDGVVDAEPLYLSAVTVGGQTHNVLYVVTEHASVYAFDADSGTQLWKVSALGSGETTSDNHGCSQITPEIGITSTPVIDRTKGVNGTMFVVAMSKDSKGAYHQRLHALDLTTGAETAGSPTEIAGTYPGTGDNSSGGNVVFAPGQYAERAGLLLMNSTIYLAWTSHCDARPYT